MVGVAFAGAASGAIVQVTPGPLLINYIAARRPNRPGEDPRRLRPPTTSRAKGVSWGGNGNDRITATGPGRYDGGPGDDLLTKAASAIWNRVP